MPFDPTPRIGNEAATAVLNGGPLHSFAAGRTLSAGRYMLRRPLGSGGMAVVWLAHDHHLERLVAIKALSDPLAGDSDYLVRFDREARIAAQLNHPNLVPVYDFDSGRRPFLVMEYIAGGDLAGRIESGEAPDLAAIARGLLGALEHIHAAGVIHRDIKPQNVLIGLDGRARLTDFGIARPRGATALTSTGLVLGTSAYIAPEVMTGGPSDERSDLYSLGVTLAEAAGECAVAPGLRGLIERLRANEPGERPRSARRALAELERLPNDSARSPIAVAQVVAEPGPFTAESSVAPDPAVNGASRWVPAWLVAALAVVVLIVIAIGDGGAPPGEDGALGGKATAGKASRTGKSNNDDQAAVQTTPAASGGTSAPASGSELNDQGYELIGAGRYEEAIPILARAVEALASSGEIAYAYALFNLGSALRLAGRPEAAIPILEQRLEIPNQRGVVRKELELARAEAGRGEGVRFEDD